jgi:pheromone shutdown-related protein TraB
VDSQKDIVKTIQCNRSQITLVGTAHVSRQSVELVEERINSDEYDCVAVELCEPRLNNLTDSSTWKNLDVFQIFRQKKATLLLVNLALSAYQRRLAKKIGVQAGQEMIRAVELAREKNLRLEVIDRNVSTTLQRMVTGVSFWQKLKIISGLIAGIFVGEEISEQQIEDLKQGDMLHAVVEEFGQTMPQVKSVLIDERDEYMTGKLMHLGDNEDAPKNVIAFVGAGHLVGMMPSFDNPPTKERLEELDQKPPSGKTGLYIGWGICLLILSMFYVGYQRSPELGWQLVMTWVFINGGLSALGALLALAHPLTILTAFLAAPLTSLNPTISAGIVVGLVESYLRKPRVSDFESLKEDLAVMSMWWKNGVMRVLIVFLFANIGSMVGTYVAGASIITQILK